MDALDKLRAVSLDPCGYAQHLRSSGEKPVLGCFCTYMPEEIIVAAGAVPFRIMGSVSGGGISLADAHLQSYCCSLVRSSLEDALAGRLSFLDGAVFPHTCDSIQRLSDIWRLNAGMKTHFDVVLPVKLTTDSARTYLIAVLERFRQELEAAFGIAISGKRLYGAIRTCNRIRGLLEKICSLRSRRPHQLEGADIYHIVRASMVMERNEALGLLQELWEELSALSPQEPPGDRKRILLTGGICSHPDIYHLIEDAGADVVWDDLCTGTRSFQGLVDEAGSPMEAIADRYLARMVCPAKHTGTTARGDHLVRLLRDKQIDGVIFLFLKFCDPHGFDYPYLKSCTDEAGVASLLLEVEEQLPAEGQLRTRFETFVDML